MNRLISNGSWPKKGDFNCEMVSRDRFEVFTSACDGMESESLGAGSGGGFGGSGCLAYNGIESESLEAGYGGVFGAVGESSEKHKKWLSLSAIPMMSRCMLNYRGIKKDA